MAVANTLAYYVTATITAVKSFIVQAPRYSINYGRKKFQAQVTMVHFLNYDELVVEGFSL